MKGVRAGIKAGFADRAQTQWQREKVCSWFCARSKNVDSGKEFRVPCAEGACGKPEEAMEGKLSKTNTLRQTPVPPSPVLFRKTVRFMGARLLQHLSYKDQIIFFYLPSK